MPKTQNIRVKEGKRPSTAATSASQPGMQKSHIPKFRSLSTPPSVSAMNSTIEIELQETLPEDIKCSILESEMFNDPSLITEEFKDCLESVKLELQIASATDLTIDEGSAAEILDKLNSSEEVEQPSAEIQIQPIPEKVEKPTSHMEKPKSGPIQPLSCKNSNSGIPVCMSLTGKNANTSRITPRPRKPPQLSSKRTRPSSTSTIIPAKLEKKPEEKHENKENKEKQTPNSISPLVKRNLDMFIAKKKRYDTLCKDLQDKHKPILDLYNTLQQLKKKLADVGNQYTIEPPVEKCWKKGIEKQSVGTDADTLQVDTAVLKDMKKSVEEIRQNSLELFRNMMEKRAEILMVFDNMVHAMDKNDAKQLLPVLEKHRAENASLDETVMKMLRGQESELREIMALLTQLSDNILPQDHSEQETSRYKELLECQTKIQMLQDDLAATQKELCFYQDASKERQACGDALRTENDKLRQKITTLEKQIEHEKKKASTDAEKLTKSTELNLKNLRIKIKELENAKVQNEGKIAHLQQDLRSAQNKVKMNEKNYEKEIADLSRSRNLDRAVIETLNKDKSTIETRLHMANQLNEELQVNFSEKEKQLREEVEVTHKEVENKIHIIDTMRRELEAVRVNMSQIEKHSLNESSSKNNVEIKNEINEKQCGLQIELAAQRVGIQALEEQIEKFAVEKKKFLDIITQLKKEKSDKNADLLNNLVQKDEQIKHFHHMLKTLQGESLQLRSENSNLRKNLENIREQMEMMRRESEGDLQRNIKEGKNKLEEALQKALENEQKLLECVQELSQKNQIVEELENTLKMRDGLIGVLKTKKEELLQDNRSLEEYSSEVRQFVIEANQELKAKADIIESLKSALEQNTQTLRDYEQQVQLLKEEIATVNKKRFQIQDSVKVLEHKLSRTHACKNLNEYEETIESPMFINGPKYTDSEPYGMVPWTMNSLRMYNHYKDGYINDKFGGVSMSVSVSSLDRISSVPFSASTTVIESVSSFGNSPSVSEECYDYFYEPVFVPVNNLHNIAYQDVPRQEYWNIPDNDSGCQIDMMPEQFAPAPKYVIDGEHVFHPFDFSDIENYQVPENGIAWFNSNPLIHSSIQI